MDCERIKELLLSYIDNEIDDDERKLVEVHLSGCAECTAEMEALAVTGSRLRQAYETVVAGVSPSPGVWQAIKSRVEAKRPTGERDADRAGLRWGWLFGWRRPVWRTAVAGAAMLSFMIVFVINSAPLPLWTADEQQAIDIANSDPDVQEMLDGQGIAYEVLPLNGGVDTELYQVAFVSFDEFPSRRDRNFAGSEIVFGDHGADSDDSYYQVGFLSLDESSLPSEATLTDSVSGSNWYDSNSYTGESFTLSITPCSEALNVQAGVVVDVSNNAVIYSNGYAVGIDSDYLTAEQVQDAAQIAKADSRISAEALVKNVSLLNDYDVEIGEFTDEMVIWVRLSLEGDIYFAQVDLDEQKVVKLLKGGE